MGLGGISPGSLLLIFFIVLILFGTKKLRSIGEDLGQAVRGFRRALNNEEPWYQGPQATQNAAFQEQNQTTTSAAQAAPELAAETTPKDKPLI